MNYHLPLTLKVNGEEAQVFKMARTVLDNLTKSAALDIVNGEQAVAELLENRQPANVIFNLIPGHGAEILFMVPGFKMKKKKKKAFKP